jgi:hypothetical protein
MTLVRLWRLQRQLTQLARREPVKRRRDSQ